MLKRIAPASFRVLRGAAALVNFGQVSAFAVSWNGWGTVALLTMALALSGCQHDREYNDSSVSPYRSSSTPSCH